VQGTSTLTPPAWSNMAGGEVEVPANGGLRVMTNSLVGDASAEASYFRIKYDGLLD